MHLRRGRWSTVEAAIPDRREGFQMLTRKGDLWLLGGVLPGADGISAAQDVLRFAPQGDAGFVPTGHKLPRGRRAHGAAIVGDKLYLVGGTDLTGTPLTVCDVLDLTTGEWTQAAPLTRPRITPTS